MAEGMSALVNYIDISRRSFSPMNQHQHSFKRSPTHGSLAQTKLHHPLVVVNQTTKTPHCTSCGSPPNLDELAAIVAGFSPLPPVPTDEPLDNLNLHWPATVKYTYPDGHPLTTPTDDRVVDTTSRPTSPYSAVPTATNKPAASNPQTENADAKALTPYERSLRPDEFRLLRLPFAEPDDPAHVALEICHDGDYPEYETCSYSWGGEDGDSTLCKPAFVGEY